MFQKNKIIKLKSLSFILFIFFTINLTGCDRQNVRHAENKSEDLSQNEEENESSSNDSQIKEVNNTGNDWDGLLKKAKQNSPVLDKLPELKKDSFIPDEEWLNKYLISFNGLYMSPFSKRVYNGIVFSLPSKIIRSSIDKRDPEITNKEIWELQYFPLKDSSVKIKRIRYDYNGGKSEALIEKIYKNDLWVGLRIEYGNNVTKSETYETFIEYGVGVVRISGGLKGDIEWVNTLFFDEKDILLQYKDMSLSQDKKSFKLNFEEFYTYEEGELVKIECLRSDGTQEITQLEKSGDNVTRTIIGQTSDDKIVINQTYFEGNLVEEIEKNPRVPMGKNMDFLFEYSYDEQGRLILVMKYDLDGKGFLSKVEYEYN